MRLDSNLSRELQGYMDLSSTELKLTAANMANVDTPGYRTRGMDFAAEMERVMAGVAAGNAPPSTAPGNAAVDLRPAPRLYEVGGLLERPDGNDVSMDREGMKMAQAQLKFRAGMELLRDRFHTMMDAIHADR